MSLVDMERPGTWRGLFRHALALMTHLEARAPGIAWTFGGGTVLMLRIAHRQSKDIDLFVPDPQCLGFVNPRLSDAAEAVSTDYEEAAEFVKLFLPDGEIDIVAGGSLTAHPFDVVQFAGRTVKVETCAEVVAKKMWHRGDRAKARDLYDLCAVADAEPEAIVTAAPWLVRHGPAFLVALQERCEIARLEYEEMDAIGARRSFDRDLEQARNIIEPLLQPGQGQAAMEALMEQAQKLRMGY